MNRRIGSLVVGAVALLSIASHADTIVYYHNDLAGSPVVATNESGQVIWRESYRPYGERTVNSPAAAGNKTWFTSRRQDAETGLVYMGARYYDPVVGRFISTDPVGFDEQNLHSFNRYAYANNNPYRYGDPDGREAFVIYHPGAINSSLNPNNHAVILLVPNNPSDFPDRSGWRISLNGDAIMSTLGGQPMGASEGMDRAALGNLRATPNFPGDAPSNATGGVWLPPPAGMTDTQWIGALIGAAEKYRNDKRYMPFPDRDSISYNSNSFVSGVIKAAGGEPPALPVKAPGYDKPVPIP